MAKPEPRFANATFVSGFDGTRASQADRATRSGCPTAGLGWSAAIAIRLRMRDRVGMAGSRRPPPCTSSGSRAHILARDPGDPIHLRNQYSKMP